MGKVRFILIRTADQTRDKVGFVKWTSAFSAPTERTVEYIVPPH